MEKIQDLERRIAPAPLRAKAGFAKTHSRKAVLSTDSLSVDELKKSGAKIATTSLGHNVVLNTDGTWAHVDAVATTDEGEKFKLKSDGTFEKIP